jgi:hypothetical protein
MRNVMLIVLVSAASCLAETKWSAIEPAPRGAIETRPLWERPSMGLSLQRETEVALDRGNGRIVDQTTFELGVIEGERLIRDAENGERRAFDLMRVEWDRQIQLERARRQVAQEQRPKIIERESERLAAERERFMKYLAKPRHGEAAVVDRQMKGKR